MHPPLADFAQVDTVLLDLDGTLLDLAFDNYVWRQRIPREWAAGRGLTREQAIEALSPRFAAVEGTLNWYCTDYWTRELGIDVAQVHREEAGRIAWLPGAREFLFAVRALGKRLVLLTNSHPATLAIKDEAMSLRGLFDAAWSSQELGAPKEDPRFWTAVREAESFDPARSLFVDDSVPVLRAARAAGVGQIVAVRFPDTTRPAREHHEFRSVHGVSELLSRP